MRRIVAVALAALVSAQPVRGQSDPGHRDSRFPALAGSSRTERLEAMVRLEVSDFIGAVQRADTVALTALVPAGAVPNAERPVAARAGCPSLGRAIQGMNSDRAAEARNTAIPLGGLHLGSLTVVLKSEGDTVARVTARIQEVRGGKLRFAPLEFVFLEAEGRWQLASVKGALVGLCGLAQR